MLLNVFSFLKISSKKRNRYEKFPPKSWARKKKQNIVLQGPDPYS